MRAADQRHHGHGQPVWRNDARLKDRGPCGCESTSSCHVLSGPPFGTGIANVPAAAISRPDVRITWRNTSERVDQHHCPIFAV